MAMNISAGKNGRISLGFALSGACSALMAGEFFDRSTNRPATQILCVGWMNAIRLPIWDHLDHSMPT